MLNLVLSILIFVFAPTKQLETEIKEYLSQKLKGYSKWDYTVLTDVDRLKRDNSNLDIDLQKEFQIRGGYGYIPVKENGNSNSSSSTFITVKLNLYKGVLVAARKINAGTNLTEADFELVEKNVAILKEEPVENFESIEGCSAKMNIQKDVVLLKQMIRSSKAIKIGDEITALYSAAGVEISFSAKARTEGSVGEKIQIVSKDNKTFQAKIIDAGNVIIVE